MRVKELSLKEVGPYEDLTTFKIEPGLTVVYGLNQTSGKTSKNSNYVGKSLLFSTLSEVLYEEPLVGSKQDRIQTGMQRVLLEANGKEYEIIKNKNKYTVKENGVDVEYATKTKAVDFIKTIWPLSFEEYETFVHIDSRIAHPLVMGSTAVRKDFFTKFFGLDKVDAERKLYLAELAKLRETKKAYETLKSTLFMLSNDTLSSDQLDELKLKIDRLSVKLEKAKTKQKVLSAKAQLLDLAEMIKNTITMLEKLKISSREAIDEYRTKYTSYIAACNRIIQDNFEYSQYRKQLEKYESVTSQLSDTAKTVDRSSLLEAYSKYTELKHQLQQVNREIERLSSITPVEKPKALSVDKEEILKTYYEYASLVEKNKQFKSGVCPTCHQPIKDLDYPAIVAKFARVKSQKHLIEQYELRLAAYEKYSEQQDKLALHQAEQSRLSNQLESLQELAKAYKEVQHLPEKPVKVEQPSMTLDEANNKRKAIQTRLDILESAKKYIEKIQEYWSLEDKTRPDLEAINSKINTANQRFYQYRSEYDIGRKNLDKLNQVQSELNELENQLKDVEPLEILIDLYQDKHLKKKIVQIIGNRLMELVNRYASQVFTEDYRFELDWSTSQINIICTRKAGQRLLVSDVRKLSGAESRLFTIILLLSLMSFIPTEKRPNVIIMDEADANLSSETIASFQKLLVLLLQVVESIVIITPRSEDFYPDANNYTVVRQGTSTIVKAHPSELE